MGIDITASERVIEELRLQEERLHLALRTADMGVFEWRPSTRTLEWDPEIFEMFGLPPGTPQPDRESLRRYFHPEDRELLDNLTPFSAGMPMHIEHRTVRPDGETRWIEVLGKGVFNDSGVLIRYLGICRDITEGKQAEQELRRSKEQMRALAGRVQSAAEEERLRIARELHDELGQALTAIKMDLDWVRRKHGAQGGAWVEAVGGVMQFVDSTIGLVRKIATELRPGILDALGLTAALEWQAEEFQRRTGTQCSVQAPAGKIGLSPEQKIAVFRIYQEALTNVARHAAATEVLVSLEVDNNQVVLRVEDDGQGFPFESLQKTRSLGVVGMRERALLLGGELQIQSFPGAGTQVTLRLPLKQNGQVEAATT
jgi:PAS domain S-box-containing protein